MKTKQNDTEKHRKWIYYCLKIADQLENENKILLAKIGKQRL